MILNELFDTLDKNQPEHPSEKQFASEAEAYKLVQKFGRWIGKNNADTPIRNLMQARMIRDGTKLYIVNADQFGGPDDLFIGFAYTPGLNVEENPASMLQGRNVAERKPIYYIVISVDSDIGDKTELGYSLNWTNLFGHMVHELTHYQDRSRQTTPTRGKFNQKVQAVSSKDPEAYFNSPLEFNAYFQQGMHNVISSYIIGSERHYFKPSANFKALASFDAFKRAHLFDFDRGFRDYLTPENQRRFDKRLYKFYDLLKKKISDRTLRGQEPQEPWAE
jgi:hypothetical protein